MQISRIIGLMVVSCMLAISCGRHHDPRLERIWATVADFPRKAMASLDSIDPATLSDKDRAFYNLLTIKARDKAYMDHTSDSLILTVIDYYVRHPDKDLYPEVLYYGGRVYYDLGDFPTSLRYFQEALTLLPEDTPNLRLRGSVLSQTGGLLSDLGLNKQALPYIENSVKIDHAFNDTINLVYDYKWLGILYLHSHDYDNAMRFFKMAEEWASYNQLSQIVEIKMYQAAIHYHRGDLKTALQLIRPLPRMADSITRNIVLSYAANIYLKSNIPDTAYRYACQLVDNSDPNNKINGYKILLSPGLRQFISTDSLEHILSSYKVTVDKRFRKQETNEALIQNTRYNYSVHERLRLEAEKSRSRILILTFGLLFIVSLLVGIIFYMRYRSNRRIMQLYEAMAKLRVLNKALRKDSNDCENKVTNADLSSKIVDALVEIPRLLTDEETLRLEFRKKLREVNENVAVVNDLSPEFKASRPYIRLQSYLTSDTGIADNSTVWKELENLIRAHYPEFLTRLRLLSGRELRPDDLHMALLIKCNFSPGQLAKLVGRTGGAITYRRKQLSMHLFGEKLDPIQIDNIIRSL